MYLKKKNQNSLQKRKKISHPEQPVQIAIANYLRIKKFLFTAPDAGINVSSKKMRAVYKSMGRTAGVADLIVWIPGGTLCIEVKKPKTLTWSEKSKRLIVNEAAGHQSKGQKEFETKVKSLPGHHYIVATSVADVDNYIKEHCIIPF